MGDVAGHLLFQAARLLLSGDVVEHHLETFVVENVHAQQELPALVLKVRFEILFSRPGREETSDGFEYVERQEGGVVAYHYVADGIHVLQEQAVVEFH